MSLKESIFDGYHEKELCKHLESMWKNKFNIYPQLPFTKIFDIDTLSINHYEKEFLFKTNIDYTICDKKDKPLMCIEFDGLGKGYNRGAEYIQIVEYPHRKKRLELKLKMAMENNLPFYIISYDEKTDISDKIHLTVIDGIIGQTIARMNTQDKINEYLESHKDSLESMDESEFNEYIEDIITLAEIETELTWDPIAKKASEIKNILFDKEIILRYGLKLLTSESLEMKDIYDIDNQQKTAEDIKRYGCEVSCETPKGRVVKQSWIRNFGVTSFLPLTIVENISTLLAFYEAATLNGVKIENYDNFTNISELFASYKESTLNKYGD